MDPLEEYTSLYNVRLMHFQGRKRGKNPQEVKYQFAVCAISGLKKVHKLQDGSSDLKVPEPYTRHNMLQSFSQ